MLGRSFSVDLEFDTYELLFIVSDFLKENGISHINAIEGNKLRGYGDAGMGIFEMEKKKDRDKKLKLYVETNSRMSSEILKNLIENVLEHIEENKLYEILEDEEVENKGMEIAEETSEGIICVHEFSLVKEEELLGINVSVYECKNCNKLEFYKK